LTIAQRIRLANGVSPSLAGVIWQAAGAAAQFWIGGGLKIVYDALLYTGFRKVRPMAGEEASIIGQGQTMADLR
jgi:hypothetical protein